MIFTFILWLMIWGGMYTGLYNVSGEIFSSPIMLFQGVRAFFPLLALYTCIIWAFITRSKFIAPFNPLGFFLIYCLVGLAVSLLSPEKMTALYWGGLYLSPILVMWVIIRRENSIENMRALFIINYFVAAFFTLVMLPAIVQTNNELGFMPTYFDLPFSLGEITRNGVARFALIVFIFSLVRFFSLAKKTRLLWLVLTPIAVYLLLLSQSRTALLGLGVVSILFVMLKGMRWQFLFVGPIASYIIWTSGYKWRAQGKIELLFSLTGREFTWREALNQVMQSPFLGWGFHSDRILLEFQHVHNSYIHALLHGGIVGLIFFVCAIVSIWYLILKNKLFSRIQTASAVDKPYLIESILIITFLSLRSLFESTAAFFGVDLLYFLPAVVYLMVWTENNP